MTTPVVGHPTRAPWGTLAGRRRPCAGRPGRRAKVLRSVELGRRAPTGQAVVRDEEEPPWDAA
ncbi:hypothetical protein GCM10011354_35060 [Egicoccus halophilus]|uniref:Uncharacterized protein n=1 Tax=Egicoccus halophilus TaxID=1670830 RepID=A0A8J3ADL7_9ACTN|nr:hypothetical protein GCM10011354_35060 [Egicoccus halophilus]